jgi:hypothetical protein
MDDLYSLAERFGKVGITQTNFNGRDLVLVLNRLADSGVQLHGLAMTKQDIMQAVRWTSVSSTSWISPQKYGATYVWSHGQLKSYSKEQKDQARRKERFVIQDAGFDYDKILADDPKELLRLSLWSWSQFVDSINSKSLRGVTRSVNSPYDSIGENEEEEVGGVLEPVRNRVSTPVARNPAQMQRLPILGFDLATEKRRNEKTGEMEDVDVPLLKSRSDSMRLCDTCFLAAKCPMFEENATCAYDIPIQIRTREQMEALTATMVEIQTQRVLFMKMAEDADGGHADPILSAEMDRLFKMMDTKNKMEQEGFSLTVTAKQNGNNANIMDKIFGQMAPPETFKALESAQDPESVAEQLGIIDVETDW